jgi:hypothetical protein
MDPEDGCLWIHGADDQQTIAFTPAGMEYLRELLAEHKRNRSSPRSSADANPEQHREDRTNYYI